MFKVSAEGSDEAYAAVEEEAAAINTQVMREAVEGLTADLREQMRAAGLGRIAGTWRGEVYPKSGRSLNPAGYVWSKSPDIVDAFDRGATITPLDGRQALAIPTKNVPRKGRRRMTPVEVEAEFNQDLILIRRRGKVLAFVEAVQGMNRRGFRQATAGRRKQGREVRLVLMFVMVRAVKMPKKLNIDRAAEFWANQIPQRIARKYQ